jgi:hypothetical protein
MYHVITHIQEEVKKREVNLDISLILIELLTALHVDITKAAKWHGLGDTL